MKQTTIAVVIALLVGVIGGYELGRTTQSGYVYSTVGNTYPERIDTATGKSWIGYGGAWHLNMSHPIELYTGSHN